MNRSKNIIYLLSILIFTACSKSNFLDKKPNTSIATPTTASDFQQLLENTSVFNQAGALAQLNADEYQVTYANWQAATNDVMRNSYTWGKDFYGGDLDISSWNTIYSSVFYANSVLDGLDKLQLINTNQGQYLKGWALFARAYAFYDLTKNFCKSYDPKTATTDLGIPIRLASGIDYTNKRSTLQQSYDQILNDLSVAETLLPNERPEGKLNRPSKIAVFALLARIYLDMRDYSLAQRNSEKCLNLYDKLIDYNTLDKTSTTPFNSMNDELIYTVSQVPNYNWTTLSIAKVSSEAINLYTPNDIRLAVFFTKQADGTYLKKRGYGGSGLYPFMGLATDEIYLVTAECLARSGKIESSMSILNKLSSKRWNPNATIPTAQYQNIIANDQEDALSKVLLERRKELVWRGLRWHDLKRLNKEGANITISRTLNGVAYTLPPNDNRYVFPIPNQEVNLSDIEQNPR